MVDTRDVQSIAVSSYATLAHAAYLPLAATAKGTALREWLAGVRPHVTCGRPGKAHTIESAMNVAFSHAGLRALGLDRRTLAGFSATFCNGMFDERNSARSSDLGDVGDSAPEKWRWGSGSKRAHVLLLLYANGKDPLTEMATTWLARAKTFGLELASDKPLYAAWPSRSDVAGFREHFGFVDGISQPRIDLGDERSGAADDDSLVADGELLLGHPNEAGVEAPRPLVPLTKAAFDADLAEVPGTTRRDLGRDGTYLVFRQLEQNVLGFWRFVAAHADRFGSIELCAAKLMGRWRNGAPLTLAPDDPGPLSDAHNDNAFLFRQHDDAKGLRCPLGAHIRRANPRDTLPGRARRHSLAQVRRHRILRRGRPYGTAVAGWPDPDAMLKHDDDNVERGTYFICLNADIKRQFEHIQRRWLNDPTFVCSPNDEVDPIVGRPRPGSRFLVPREPAPVLLGDAPAACTRFVTMHGGGYFFLPSKRALHYLAIHR